MDGDKARQKWESHYEAMVRLYEAFDKDTDGRYTAALKDTMARSRFLIDIKEDKDEAVLDSANAKFLSELPDTERKLLILRAKHRWLYDLLRKMYKLARR